MAGPPDEESTPITSCVTDPSLRSQESLHSKFNSVGTNYVLIIFYVGSVVLGPGDAERRCGPGPSGASKAYWKAIKETSGQHGGL